MIITQASSTPRKDSYEKSRTSKAPIRLKRKKTKKKVLGIRPVLWQHPRPLLVRSQAAIRSFLVRFAFRPICTFITGHSPSSVHIQTATRPSVRSKTSRSISGFTKISGPMRVLKAAVRASGQRETCVTTNDATLETSKYFDLSSLDVFEARLLSTSWDVCT